MSGSDGVLFVSIETLIVMQKLGLEMSKLNLNAPICLFIHWSFVWKRCSMSRSTGALSASAGVVSESTGAVSETDGVMSESAGVVFINIIIYTVRLNSGWKYRN